MKKMPSLEDLPTHVKTKVSPEKAFTREGRAKKREIREQRRKREEERWRGIVESLEDE